MEAAANRLGVPGQAAKFFPLPQEDGDGVPEVPAEEAVALEDDLADAERRAGGEGGQEQARLVAEAAFFLRHEDEFVLGAGFGANGKDLGKVEENDAEADAQEGEAPPGVEAGIDGEGHGGDSGKKEESDQEAEGPQGDLGPAHEVTGCGSSFG